jgi:hypothetical protein
MKTTEEARIALEEARASLREFSKSLSLEQATQMTVGDQTTVEVFGLKNTQSILLESVMEAEQELRDAKKAEAH